MAGWICLSRDILDSWLWNDKPFSKAQAWIDLLLLANFETRRVVLGNELIEVERGSFITSEVKLCTRWGWSKSKVRNYLYLLQSDNMIVKKTDNKKTTLTIVNYCKYQNLQTAEKPQKDREKTAKKPQKDTTNNINNITNNNLKERGKFAPPSPEEVRAYCQERNNKVDPEAFIDFYTSKGWKVGNQPMKDWKAAVRTWEKRDNRAAPKAEPKKDKIHNFKERDYDFEALTRELARN